MKLGTEVTYKATHIQGKGEIKGKEKVVWDRILKCDKCVWANGQAIGVILLISVCKK